MRETVMLAGTRSSLLHACIAVACYRLGYFGMLSCRSIINIRILGSKGVVRPILPGPVECGRWSRLSQSSGLGRPAWGNGERSNRLQGSSLVQRGYAEGRL